MFSFLLKMKEIHFSKIHMTKLTSTFSEASMDPNPDLIDKETLEIQKFTPSDYAQNLIKALNAGIDGDYTLIQEQRSFKYPTSVIEGIKASDSFFNYHNRQLLVRHYYPTECTNRESLPLFIYVHGGGWCFSYSDQRNFFASTISKKCKVEFVLINYSLSPEFKCGEALNEIHSIYTDLLNHSPKDRKVFICGDSAGGNLCACLIHKLKSASNNEKVRLPTALLLFYPVIDCVNDYPSYHRFASGLELEYEVMRKYIDAYCPDIQMRKSPLVSPIFGDLTGFPPSLVVTSQFDILRNEGLAFAKKLDECGVPVRYVCLESAGHGFLARPELKKLFAISEDHINDFLSLFV